MDIWVEDEKKAFEEEKAAAAFVKWWWNLEASERPSEYSSFYTTTNRLWVRLFPTYNVVLYII